jgi:hypothetical protein
MDRDLHLLAGIDRGPVIRGLLLERLVEGGVAHWPADALAERWPTDPEVAAALTSALDGEPVRASMLALAATRILGPHEGMEKLLQLLELRVAAGAGFRADLVAYALIEACRERGETVGTLAEKVAGACLAALEDPADWMQRDAQGAAVGRLPQTSASRRTAAAMLERAQPPIAGLLACYSADHVMLNQVLGRLARTHPRPPGLIRLHLCTLLRNATSDSGYIRSPDIFLACRGRRAGVLGGLRRSPHSVASRKAAWRCCRQRARRGPRNHPA